MMNPIPSQKNLFIEFIAIGSLDHYSQWNVLSCETLAGDIRGTFGQSINIHIHRINSLDDISRLPLDNIVNKADIIGLSPSLGALKIMDFLWEKIDDAELRLGRSPLKVIGNKVPSYFPEYCLKRYHGCMVVIGEAELSLRKLIRYVLKEIEIRDVPNIMFMDIDGSLVRTQSEPCDLEELIYAPSTDTTHDIIQKGGNVLIQSSRGCPWSSCAYCTCQSFRQGQKWVSLPIERIVTNLWNLAGIGAHEFEFADDEFLGGRSEEHINRAHKIGQTIAGISAAFGRVMSFRVFLEPASIWQEGQIDNNSRIAQLLKNMKNQGLNSVYIGVESGCPEQLRRYNRKGTLREIAAALKTLRNLGIHADVGFIMFDPMLTIEELRQNILFFKEQNLINGNQWPFRPMVVNEGAPIKERLSKEGALGRCHHEFMAYEYEFLDPKVKRIAEQVDILSSSTRALFYALKTKSKMCFSPLAAAKHILMAKNIVKRNGYIYLDAMEELATCSGNWSWQNCLKITKGRIDKLVNFIKRAVQSGELSDEDEYLRRQINVLASDKSLWPCNYKDIAIQSCQRRAESSSPEAP